MSTKLFALLFLGAVTAGAAAAGGYAALHRPAEPPQAVAAVRPAVPAPTDSAATVEPVAEPTPMVPAVKPERPAPEPAPRRVSKPAPVAAVPATKPAVVVPPPSPTPSSQPVVEVPAIDTKDARNDVVVSTPPEPVRPRYEDLTVERDAVIGIRLDAPLSSDVARVEDRVTAHVTRDVLVDGRTAIASGARLEGVVAAVERGGKFRDRPRVGVRFQSLMLPDGTRVPIQTETIFREGESPTGTAASKVGAGAAVGGILGAVLGGKKGAAIGATIGAAGGTGAVATGAPAIVSLPAGTPLTVRLTAPITVSLQQDR